MGNACCPQVEAEFDEEDEGEDLKDVKGKMMQILQNEDARDPHLKVKNQTFASKIQIVVILDDSEQKPMTVEPGRFAYLCDIVPSETADSGKAFDFGGLHTQNFEVKVAALKNDGDIAIETGEIWEVHHPEGVKVRQAGLITSGSSARMSRRSFRSRQPGSASPGSLPAKPGHTEING